MKNSTRLSFGALTLTIALGLTGCADPSENVPKAASADPQTASEAVPDGKKYVIRNASSTIGFEGSKVTGSHKGGFKNFEGEFNVVDGQLAGPQIIDINMQSTWSDSDRLTGHLLSPDFFDAENYPVTTFTATSVEKSDQGHTVTGNLKLHGVTKSISFPAEIQISEEAVTVKSEFSINRKDFDINYPGRPNDLIRDGVVIQLDINATPGEPAEEDRIDLDSGDQAQTGQPALSVDGAAVAV